MHIGIIRRSLVPPPWRDKFPKIWDFFMASLITNVHTTWITSHTARVIIKMVSNVMDNYGDNLFVCFRHKWQEDVRFYRVRLEVFKCKQSANTSFLVLFLSSHPKSWPLCYLFLLSRTLDTELHDNFLTHSRDIPNTVYSPPLIFVFYFHFCWKGHNTYHICCNVLGTIGGILAPNDDPL